MIAAPIPKLAGGKHSCRPTDSEIPPRSQGDGDVYWSDFPEDIFDDSVKCAARCGGDDSSYGFRRANDTTACAGFG